MTGTTTGTTVLDADRFGALPPERMCEIARRTAPPPTTWATRARLFVMLGRPRTCVPAWLSYWLGTAYADRPLGAFPILLGALLAFGTSFAANVHNAYTDLDEDSHNLPGRVWMVARLGYRRLRHYLVALDVAMLAGAALLGWVFLGWFALAVLALHQYSFRPLRLKSRPLGGLLLFAGVLPVPFLCAWAIEREGWLIPWAPEPYLAVLAFLFLWFLAKGLFKNVPDFYGDRAAGVRTSATAFRTWRGAALAAAVATLVVYALPVVLVVRGDAAAPVLASLVFWPVAAVQCARLVRADDGAAANHVLRTDMTLSIAFLAALLLLQAPTVLNGVAVVLAAVVLFGADLLGIDSRRGQDTGTGAAPPGRPRTPQRLFDRVAPYYDAMNSALSLGRDRRWRRAAADALHLPPGATVLDVAAGTGAMARAVRRRHPGVRRIVGIDLNAAMLAVHARRGDGGPLVRGDVCGLPFACGAFDAVTLGFAIDDVADPDAALAEIRRVLVPGGTLVLLELSLPSRPGPRRLYRACLRVLSAVGRVPGCAGYRHLRDEIDGYRGATAVTRRLERAGLVPRDRRELTLGLATLHVADRAPDRHPEQEG